MAYPMPYPAPYGPPPGPPRGATPSPVELDAHSPHKHVVCRGCGTIVVNLSGLPKSGTKITRHYTDARPVSISQTFRADAQGALSALARGLSGIRRLAREDRSPLLCRGCRVEVGRATRLSDVVDGLQVGEMECVRVTFNRQTVLLSDAYGREIKAAAEVAGMWARTPAPYGVWPWR